MIIREMTPVSYKITMADFRSALADSNLDVDGIGILGCFDTQFSPLGFAMYKNFEKVCSILYIEYAKNQEQVLSALIDEIRHKSEKKQLEKIYWNTDLDFLPEGFIEDRYDRLYRISKAERTLWEKFKVRIDPILRRTELNGLLTVPLSLCTPEQLEQIEKLYRAENDSGYMERILSSKDGKLLANMSFVTFCGDDIVTFCIFTESDENGCMLKYLYARPDFRNSAVMLQPFLRCIDAFFESQYKNLRWTIRSDNRYSMNIVTRHFPEILPRLSIHSYTCTMG